MRSTPQPYRRDLRIAVRFPIVVESGGETVTGCWARDISAGGMLFTCPRVPLIGSRLNLSFAIEGEPPEVRAAGIVKRVHSSRLSLAQEPSHLVAVRFIEIPDSVQRGLRRLVMDRVIGLIETMRVFPAFAKLPEFDLMALAGVCRRIKLAAGERLVRQGDEASSLYVVSSGRVELSGGDGPADRVSAVDVAVPGQIFGEVSTLTGLPHDLDILAVEDTQLIGLTREGLFFLRECHPETALRVMDIIVRFAALRLRRLTRRLLAPLPPS